jgi:hypothetical protein
MDGADTATVLPSTPDRAAGSVEARRRAGLAPARRLA